MQARRTKLVLTLLGLGLSLGAGLLLYERFIAARPEQVSPEQLALGRGVYQAHCATCHGADLEGQPNWRKRGADGLMPAICLALGGVDFADLFVELAGRSGGAVRHARGRSGGGRRNAELGRLHQQRGQLPDRRLRALHGDQGLQQDEA